MRDDRLGQTIHSGEPDGGQIMNIYHGRIRYR